MDYNTLPPQENLPHQDQPQQPAEPLVDPVVPKTFNKIFYIALAVLVVLAGLGVGAYYWYSNSQNQKLANNVTKNSNTQAEVADAPTADPLVQVKAVFDKINSAKDEATFRLYLTQNSIKALDELEKAGFSNTFTANHLTYISAKLDPSGNKAYITATQPDPDNKPQQQTLIFVKESDGWKFDLDATFNQEFDKATAEYDQVASSPNGIAGSGVTDLAVLDFVVTPNSPTAADNKVTLEARIKNVGQTTLSKFEGRGAIDDFDFPINYQGIIKPGEVVRVDVVPYEAYLFHLKNNNQTPAPGTHTLWVSIDNENKLGDTNKSNNTLTQKITFK